MPQVKPRMFKNPFSTLLPIFFSFAPLAPEENHVQVRRKNIFERTCAGIKALPAKTDLPQRCHNKRAVKKSTDSCPLFKKSHKREFDFEHVLNEVFSAGVKNVTGEKTIVCGLVAEILRCDRDKACIVAANRDL
ncbi:hypothetical protein HNY73_008444 [Argiope bruennichi]|uniref:Uncharacterized protein n=1 Tax=Argiope bruennichi TaxID=94029 RepID=A0A8T0F7D8_ARGBR|nr:hypothetical protein HNY73_008444 [Argiope bruennichi]